MENSTYKKDCKFSSNRIFGLLAAMLFLAGHDSVVAIPMFELGFGILGSNMRKDPKNS